MAGNQQGNTMAAQVSLGRGWKWQMRSKSYDKYNGWTTRMHQRQLGGDQRSTGRQIRDHPLFFKEFDKKTSASWMHGSCDNDVTFLSRFNVVHICNQVKAITECFQECAAGYTLEWKVGPSWEAAVAVPKQQTCSKLPDIRCSEVVLLCSKPFGEFPNACAGTLPLSQASFYVAFYSYGKEVDGKVTTILDTRVVASKDEVCSGMYSVNSGECMGLVAGDQSSQGVVAPPDPPADAVKNLPISKWPVPNIDPVTSSVTKTSSTKPGDTTEKPTETPPETTETPHEPTEKPSESTKAPEPEKDTGSGHILLWFLAGGAGLFATVWVWLTELTCSVSNYTSLEIVLAKSSTLFFSMFYLVRFPHCQGVLVVAVCVAAFFYHRRGRLMEDERQLRGEVELNTSVNRFWSRRRNLILGLIIPNLWFQITRTWCERTSSKCLHQDSAAFCVWVLESCL